MSNLRYYAKRSGQTVVLLYLLLTAIFLLFRLMPGDFVTLIAGTGAPPEIIEATRERWGLNEPLHIQYITYISNVIQLDLGTSLYYRVPVWDYVRIRMFNSFILLAPAITLAYIVASLVGAYMGGQRDSRAERWGVVPVVFMGSLPTFFLGILLIVIFASGLSVFPTSGMVRPSTIDQYEAWWRPYFTYDFLSHAALPFLTVFLHYLYTPTLIMRTSAVEVANKNFIEYHRRTGIGKYRTLKHLGISASLPVITVFPVSLAKAVGGLVLVETVFNWPGIGYALVQAVFQRDYPVLQAVFFAVAAFVIIGNFVVDIVYGKIDPRVTVAGDD